MKKVQYQHDQWIEGGLWLNGRVVKCQRDSVSGPRGLFKTPCD
jgi:hypothetical protein